MNVIPSHHGVKAPCVHRTASTCVYVSVLWPSHTHTHTYTHTHTHTHTRLMSETRAPPKQSSDSGGVYPRVVFDLNEMLSALFYICVNGRKNAAVCLVRIGE